MDRAEADELLRTLFTDPAAARARAAAELVPDPDPHVASVGHQVVAIVLRDLGHPEDALAHLGEALRLARRTDDGERAGDVRATLGATLARVGRVREGMRELDRAAEGLTGLPLARLLVRRAQVLGYLLARYEDSMVDLRRAVGVCEREGDLVWKARAINLMGLAHVALGELAEASVAFEEFGRLSAAEGNASAVATSVHNLGWVAQVGDDLPLALARYAEASDLFASIGQTSTDLVTDWCRAYLAGGLAADATAVAEQALAARPLLPPERADVLVSLADAALAAGSDARAADAAEEASALLRVQGRAQARVRADLLALTARSRMGGQRAPLLRRAERLVVAARSTAAPELPQVLLLAARVARSVRSQRAARLAADWSGQASASTSAATANDRALGWLAAAWLGASAGDAAATLRACDRGLTELDEHRATFGSQELRALSSGHGAELAELGTRTALESGDARRLLRWSERWRATALSVPSAFGGHDAATTADLAALRVQQQRIAEARAEGAPTDRLQARASRLEQDVRRRLLHARGSGRAVDVLDVGALLEALAEDDTVLVELAEIDGVLHALVAGGGRVRHRVVGSAEAAARAVDFALFMLRQAARGRRAQLDVAGARLQDALVGPALDGVPGARVVVSATSALQGVPWGLLPGLADRAFTSTPSARLWLRARAAAAEDDRRVLLVGPGLGSGGAEVPAVAAEDPDAEVIDGSDATVAASLAALDGAALAHVAAHGHFREDSPLFSSLTLADGPLLVHDLQRLERPPHRVVLSACESGVMQPVGDQELLGLSAALLSMGTAGVVSSLAEVDDEATVEVMVALHARLREGGGLGDALLAARRAAAGSPVLAATAASFTVLGV
ncbi:tetratricopeptide (TPR) repeat protein [Nocardioides cavernae]|uniref:Tetratricopeptide (TPR) repeat protein n=1 Tax=Nocardioides cavernae TaxID=1921566 RepID=A0A7Y9H6Y9_9ACTN|nr:CHAT domain-containing protein [Nocardioides cavernae]NYE38836.1 tetratricopeptide (TPR) repeat protein [Nocardioides cavernae]